MAKLGIALASILLVGLAFSQAASTEREKMGLEGGESKAKIPSETQMSETQTGLTDLDEFGPLLELFQSDDGQVRLITLLSPTCPMCRRGFGEMQKVLNNISDNRIRAYIVWLPILTGDDRASAAKRSNEFDDERVTYLWDGGRLSGKLWQNLLGIGVIAWDVYFLYGADAQWDEEATVPDFWMHQLGGMTKAPVLDEQEFELKAKELLGKIE